MILTALRVASLYSLFAAVSTAINIAAQMLSVWVYSGLYFIEASILFGTIAGLPLRYVLEKRFIFKFRSQDIAHDGRLFVTYSMMGVVTTLIFWGTEYAFHLIYGSDFMRYFGGVIGLMIGYAIKYQLDKKYVFVTRLSEADQ